MTDSNVVEQNAADSTLSDAVVESVADSEGVNPIHLDESLYETVNPDALDSLFRASTGSVVFEFYGYIVTVDSDGQVDLTDAY